MAPAVNVAASLAHNDASAFCHLMPLILMGHEFQHLSIAKCIKVTAIIACKMLVDGHCSKIDSKHINRLVSATPINVAVTPPRCPDEIDPRKDILRHVGSELMTCVQVPRQITNTLVRNKTRECCKMRLLTPSLNDHRYLYCRFR